MTTSDRMTTDEFLEGFGEVRHVIRALFDIGRREGWSLRIGSAEASMQRSAHAPDIVLYLSAAYSWGPYARIWCSSLALRDRLVTVLAAVHGSDKTRAEGESVKLFLGSDTAVSYLIPLLDAL